MKFLATLILLSLVGCSSHPVLYPNDRYKVVGKPKEQEEITRCEEDADEYLTSGKGKNIAKGAGAGAFIGGAMGAVKGLFTGNVLGGAVEGGAIGGAGGAAVGSLTPDQVKREYVNKCLADKGFQVIGWD